jgi:peptidoglycan/LPS O-acetylase OafA/YrhL
MSRERIASLDGIRGVAVLLVVGGHIAQNYQPLGEEMRRWLVAFANPGVGVRIFFVLSGYLITHLLLKELAATKTISLASFYWRRALRIFPAFYVYLFALTLAQFRAPSGITPATWTAAATFSWNYSFFWVTPPPEGYWNLGHLWTLALEQQFYLAWPVTLFLCGPKKSLWITGLLIGWCPIARVATYFLFPAQRGMVVMMFHTGIDSLMAGCAAALLLRSGPPPVLLGKSGLTGAAAAGLWLGVLSPLAGEWLHGFPIVIGISLDALATAWVISWLHVGAPASVQSWLGRGVLPALGAISYSLYLWQQWFLSPAGFLSRGQVLPAVAGAVVAASFSYWLIEKPCLRFKVRLPQPRPLVGRT